MSDELLLDLADCTEYRQTLMARPPGIAHGVTVLAGTLLATALIWAALTEADLVVRAVGAVRPVTVPQQVFTDFRGDVPSVGIAIAEVKFRQGDRVKRGNLLLRMDSTRLDNEISKRELSIAASEKELALLADRETVLRREFEKAQAQVRAELLQAEKDFQRATEQRRVNIKRAVAELEAARQHLARMRNLLSRDATAIENVERATARERMAQSDWEAAQLEVVDRVEVFRRKLEWQEQEYQGKLKDLERRRADQQRQLDITQSERAKLLQERQQATVLAPIDGVVTSLEPKVGDLPGPATPLVEIAEENGFLFEAQVLNEDVGLLRENLPARIKVNTFDYQKYGTLGGTVSFLSPDSSLVQGRAIFLVRIALEGDEVGRGEYRGKIKFGMTGQVEIVTDHESLLCLLVRRIRQSISLG